MAMDAPDFWMRGTKIELIELVKTVELLKTVELISKINLVDKISSIDNVTLINTIDLINKIVKIGAILSDFPLGYNIKPLYATKLTNYILVDNREDVPTSTMTETAVAYNYDIPAETWTPWFSYALNFDAKVEGSAVLKGTITGNVKFGGHGRRPAGAADWTIQIYYVAQLIKVADSVETVLAEITSPVLETFIGYVTDGIFDATLGFNGYVSEAALAEGNVLRFRIRVYVRCKLDRDSTIHIYTRHFHDNRNPDSFARVPFKL